MALPDYTKKEQGTVLSWKSTGGTYALTLTSLTNGTARQGAKGDLGATWAREWAVLFSSAVAAAATNGNEIELWWGSSPTATAGTDNPSNLTGTDVALASPDEVKFQSIFIGSIVLSNTLGTGIQRAVFAFQPKLRYGSPFVVNKSGLALSATAANHEVRLIASEDLIQETV